MTDDPKPSPSLFERIEARLAAEDAKNEGPARIVREALHALALDETTNPLAAHFLGGFAREASDYTLAKLARLLR